MSKNEKTDRVFTSGSSLSFNPPHLASPHLKGGMFSPSSEGERQRGWSRFHLVGGIGVILVSIFLFLFSPAAAHAADLYWIGAAGANTDVASNWSTTDPTACSGTASASAPGTADVAIFDADCDNGATINASISLQKLQINAGYVGTITQSATTTVTLDPGTSGDALAIADGTLTDGANASAVIDINDGNFNQSGGIYSHTGTSSSMTVEQNFTVSAGTFTNTGNTVTLNGLQESAATVTCSGTLSGTVGINKTSSGSGSANDVTVASGCTIGLGASPTTTLNSSGNPTTTLTNNGTITVASGTWTVTAGASTTTVVNNGTITHSGTGWDFNDASLTNNSGATITYAGTAITIERNFTQNGTFNLSGITVTFDGTSSSDNSTMTCASTLGGTVVFTKTNSSSGGTTNAISSGCSVNFGASPTTSIAAGGSSSASTLTNNGTIVIDSGTWTVTSPATLGLSLINAGTITHTGATPGWDFNDASLTNNSGATITYAGTAITMERSFTQSGTFDLTGKTVTFDDTSSSDDTTVTCSGSLGGTVVITKNSDGDFINASGCSIALGASPTTTIDSDAVDDFTNNGTVTIASGTWTVTSPTGGILTNAGTITHSGSDWDFNETSLTNNSGATITYAGATITIERNFTQNGTFDLTGKTVTFDSTGSNDDSTMTCTGSLGGTVAVTKTSAGADMTIASGCSISLGASPTTTLANASSSTGLTNNGTITISSGTWTVAGSTSTLINAGTITHNGNGWDFNDSSLTNNSGATITYSGTAITIERNFTQNGTFDLTGKTVTLDNTAAADDDSTLTCGTGVSLGSLTINKTFATADTTLASNCTLSGDLTRTDGPLTNPAAAYILTVQGNLSISTTDTFGGTNLTLTMGGSGTQTITQNAGTMSGVFKVDKSGGSATLATNFATGSTCNVVEGNFDIEGKNFTCGSTFTVEDGGNLQLQGGETTVTSPTLNTGSTVTYDGTTSFTTLKLGNTYQHLTFNGSGGTWQHDATLDINGNSTITNGTLNSSGQNITLAGNWSNAGSYTSGTNTVTFDGSGDQTLNTGGTGTSNDFDTLTVNKAGGTLSLTSNALDVDTAFTLTAGTFSANGLAATFAPAVTLSAGTYQASTATQTFNGGLTISGATFTGGTSTVDVNGVLTISSGTMTAPSGTLTVSGTFTHSAGTFTHNSGTVNLDGTDQTLSGATTFNNLTKTVTTARTLTFPTGSGSKQTIVGTTTLQGASGALLSLRSSTSGTQWQFDPQGTRTISYVDAKDSYNTNATTIATAGNNITDSGNNTGWSFNPEAPTNFAGTAQSSSSIKWTWTDNATDETGFRLQDSSGTTIATINTANTTSYTETGLTRGTSYTRRVVAFNDSGTSDASSTATVSTSSSAPTSPALKSPNDGATLTTIYPTFTFGRSTDDDDGIDTYTLLINPTKSDQKSVTFSNPKNGATIVLSSATVTATEDTISVTIADGEWLQEGTTYTWKARATDTAGNTADSDIRTFTIKGSSTDTTSPRSPGSPASPGETSLEELATRPPSITDVIEAIERGEIPTRAPEALQLEELGKQARLRLTRQSQNLFAFLQRLIPYDLLARFDRGLSNFILLAHAQINSMIHQAGTRFAALFGFGRDQLLALGNLIRTRVAFVSSERERLTGEINHQVADLSQEQTARFTQAILDIQEKIASKTPPPIEEVVARLRENIPEVSAPDTHRLAEIAQNALISTNTVITGRRDAALADLRGFSRFIGQGIIAAQDAGTTAHNWLITARNNRLELARGNEASLDRAFEPARAAWARSRSIVLFAWDTMRGANDKPFRIADVTIENLDSRRAVISWKTSRISTGKVNYGPSLAYGADGEGGEAYSDELALSHRVEVTDLTPNTRIYQDLRKVKKRLS